MFTRRDAMKTTIAVRPRPPPAVVAATETSPAPAGPTSKVRETGIVRLRLPIGYQAGTTSKLYTIAVEIMPLDAWRALDALSTANSPTVLGTPRTGTGRRRSWTTAGSSA